MSASSYIIMVSNGESNQTSFLRQQMNTDQKWLTPDDPDTYPMFHCNTDGVTDI